MAQIIDGKAAAGELREETRVRVEEFRRRHGRAPGLTVVLVGEDPASTVYVRNKERAAEAVGLVSHVHRLSAQTELGELLALITRLNHAPLVDGILVQLPLPKGLDAARVIEAIDPQKDVDGLHATNAGLLLAGRKGLRPCTPSGCVHLIKRVGATLAGARALVVGRSILVGKPVALMLLEEDATVTIAHSKTRDLKAELASADIVIAAIGKPRMIHGSALKPGAVVIDVGINRLPDGSLVGDVDFDSALERASWITPVPGGVGPMTIAMLLSNTVTAAEAREPQSASLTNSASGAR